MKRFKPKPQKQARPQQAQKPKSKVVFMTHPQSDDNYNEREDRKKSWGTCMIQGLIDEWILKLENGTGKKFTVLLLFFVRYWEAEDAFCRSCPRFYVEFYDGVTNKRLLRDWSITCERQDFGHSHGSTPEINGVVLDVRMKDLDVWNVKGAHMYPSEGHVYLLDHFFGKDVTITATAKLIELLK